MLIDLYIKGEGVRGPTDSITKITELICKRIFGQWAMFDTEELHQLVNSPNLEDALLRYADDKSQLRADLIYFGETEMKKAWKKISKAIFEHERITNHEISIGCESK
jgi:hypothetical protein